METANIATLVILVITGIMIFFGVRNWWPVKPTPKAKSGPSATTTAGTSGGAVAATATPPATTPPTPAPAPATTSRSWGWVWRILIIIVVVLIGRWVWYEGPNVRSTYSPQATAPGKTVRQKFNMSVNLLDTFNEERGHGSIIKVISGTPFLFIGKDGKAVFEIAQIPKKDFLVRYTYALGNKQSAYISFKINGTEIPYIFTPAPEGQAAVGINKEMIREKNTLTISTDQAVRISGFRFEEK